MLPINPMRLIKFYIILSIFTFAQQTIFAQALYEVPIEEKTQLASIITEGKVINQQSFWNTQHSMIYTDNTVLVYKLFKGTSIPDTIHVLTVGGSVGTESIEASDLLQLNINEIGLFYCSPNALGIQSPIDQTVLLDVYSSAQGFIKYDLNTQTASSPFKKYSNITSSLYQAVEAQTGRGYKTIRNLNTDLEQNRATNITAPAISSFSPATVNAGAILDPTTNVLTINGSGFGSTPSGSAAVFFDNPDDGTGGTPFSVAYNSPNIVSWADNQIVIRVPTKAGTGSFGVIDASGNQVTASSNLNVLYSIITSIPTSAPNYVKEVNNINDNGSGGYTVVYSTNTAGGGVDLNASGAKSTFQRALTTWKEISGYNVIEGGTTTVQTIARDGNNNILYDNTNTGISPLASGVLAVCYSYFQICSDNYALNQTIKREFDIVIRNAGVSSGTANFTFGPCPPNATDYSLTDLETVLLHELGHSIGLGHINDTYTGSIGSLNPSKIMNYTIVNSSKRVSPDYSAKAGAAYLIQQQGNVYGGCVITEMTPLSTTLESKDDCPTTLPNNALTTGTVISFDLVHATSNKFTDPSSTNFRCNGSIGSQTNNAYYAFKTNASGGTMSIAVSGYTTTPSALTSCTQVYGGIPVTGIRLALYDVTSGLPTTPEGYPTVLACREFSGNGSLTEFSGLSANANYLIMVEGIENTKANFTFSFSGTAITTGVTLPLSSLILKANTVGKSVSLTFTASNEQDINQYFIEHSSDGILFSKIGEVMPSINNNALSNTYRFVDQQPTTGNNFYRIKGVSANNMEQYSNVTMVNLYQHKPTITVSPNPIEGKRLQLKAENMQKGNYACMITDVLGKVVYQKEIFSTGANEMLNIELPSSTTPGLYCVQILGGSGPLVYKFLVK
jgi:hypothetical protein